jgi:hypothetical protein
MKSLLKFILLFTLAFPASGKAQSDFQPDSLLNKLIGKWTLKGSIEERETTHDVNAERVLNGQYVQLKEVSREKDEKGNPSYTAIVYLTWLKAKNEYECLWLDNTSNAGLSNGITGRAKPNGDKIEFVFKYSDTLQFHTAFLYDRNADTWQWFMDEDNNGKLQPFARMKMTRNK